MRTHDDTAAGGSAPTRQDEAGIMRQPDWGPVIRLIGTHPRLVWHDLLGWGIKLRSAGVKDCPTSVANDLMLQHATAWLDERGVCVRRITRTTFGIIEYGHTPAPVVAALDAASPTWPTGGWPTRLSATIAAVVAAAEGGGK